MDLKTIFKGKPKTTNLAEEIKRKEKLRLEVANAKIDAKKEYEEERKQKKSKPKEEEGIFDTISRVATQASNNLESWNKAEKKQKKSKPKEFMIEAEGSDFFKPSGKI